MSVKDKSFIPYTKLIKDDISTTTSLNKSFAHEF